MCAHLCCLQVLSDVLQVLLPAACIHYQVDLIGRHLGQYREAIHGVVQGQYRGSYMGQFRGSTWGSTGQFMADHKAVQAS
jgi:hypothetical protein